MINKIRLYNFKAFEDSGEVYFKPLTILAGCNSAGKTTIIQSLLLLKQTLIMQDTEINLGVDGPYVEFSTLKELTYQQPKISSCEIGFNIGFEAEGRGTFVRRKTNGTPERKRRSNIEIDMDIFFRFKSVSGREKRIVIDRTIIRSKIDGKNTKELEIKLQKGRYRKALRGEGIDLLEGYIDRGAKVINADFWHFLPQYFYVEKNGLNGEEIENKEIHINSVYSGAFSELPNDLKERLSYLGPLREEPRRTYPKFGSPSREIGQKGEFAAQILWLEKDEEVEYPVGISGNVKKMSLLEAVNKAFKDLGLMHDVGIQDLQMVVLRILLTTFSTNGRGKVTIADVGFGVSQLLPIVVMGLRAKPGELLVFEQPEIHLHPRLQANLADFFIRLAKTGKRLLVETHSDHFINRLRRRIAEDEIETLKDDVSILFVRPPSETGGATIEPLSVDKFGVIENWPTDFLPESADESEAILKAGMKKRTRR